jgi:hypothetical protein
MKKLRIVAIDTILICDPINHAGDCKL